MMVEVHGAGFRNKGAQLMLEVTIAKLRRAGCDAVCADPILGHPTSAYDEAGLLRLFPPTRPFHHARPASVFFSLSRVAGRVLPKAPAGHALRQAPRALIDISGYAFGDSWGARRIENFARRARYYKRRSRPVIMMPQMLGPFDDERVARAFDNLLPVIDVLYARDRISFEAAHAVWGTTTRLQRAPDLTIFSRPADTNARPSDAPPYVCLVPNQRMLDKGRDRDVWKQCYVDRLVAVGRQVLESGRALRLVVHDTTPGGDGLMAEGLRRALPGAQLETASTPRALKAVLAGAELVVGSRFHAIVGALSSGVPSVVLGWSHKYEMLLDEFGTPDLLHRATDTTQALLALVQEALDPAQQAARRATIASKKAEMRPQNEAMWRDVLGRLRLDASTAADAA